MAELEKIVRVIKKFDPSAPHATLLVLDATVGPERPEPGRAVPEGGRRHRPRDDQARRHGARRHPGGAGGEVRPAGAFHRRRRRASRTWSRSRRGISPAPSPGWRMAERTLRRNCRQPRISSPSFLQEHARRRPHDRDRARPSPSASPPAQARARTRAAGAVLPRQRLCGPVRLRRTTSASSWRPGSSSSRRSWRSRISYALVRKLPIMPLVSGVVVVVFGGLTLSLQDEVFIKLKPTIVNTLFGLDAARRPLFPQAPAADRARQRVRAHRGGLAQAHLALGAVLLRAGRPQRDRLAHADHGFLGQLQGASASCR